MLLWLRNDEVEGMVVQATLYNYDPESIEFDIYIEVHCFVLVLQGHRQMKQPFFLLPTRSTFFPSSREKRVCQMHTGALSGCSPHEY